MRSNCEAPFPTLPAGTTAAPQSEDTGRAGAVRPPLRIGSDVLGQ